MVARRTGTGTWKNIRARWARKRLPCARCHEPIDYRDTTNGPKSFTLDHIKEVADGGTDHDDNLQPLHRACHQVKTADSIRARAKGRRSEQARSYSPMSPADEAAAAKRWNMQDFDWTPYE